MIEYILFVLGIVLLIKGADYLVKGSSSLAKKLGIPTLIIGLTIVALGTSTPELVVNILAALKGSTEVAFGNIIGSNIANILLVLGIVAIICPIKVKSSTIWKEIPFALLGVVVLFVASNYFLIDKITINSLTRVSGIIFLCFFLIFIYYAFGLAKRHKVQLDQGKKEVIKHQDIDIEKHKNITIFLMVLGGLIGLYFGGKWVVEGAIFMAQQLGLSEFLISVTIIALGTSLPELVTGITAAKKKDTELAVGNSVGSNIFNIFWILGITAIIAPIAIPNFINLDIVFLGIATFLLFLSLFIGKKHELERWQGYVFVILYIAYIAFIIIRG
jgi:cation:H+ antiporter